MKIAVWDTYVERLDGRTMHFDILLEHDKSDLSTAITFGKKYLGKKPFPYRKLTAQECRLCHFETASASLANEIDSKGYAIIEMENCS